MRSGCHLKRPQRRVSCSVNSASERIRHVRVSSNGLELEVLVQGDDNAPAVLLIMGLGMQMVAWPPALVSALLNGGYRVITFDNRDIGLSTKTTGRTPNLLIQALKYRMGLSVRAAYTLRDMVEDTRGLLDALDVAQCHVVGASMGGMIAQGLASHHPHRVISLTSIMSTTGARGLPQATPKATMALLSRPKSKDRDVLIKHFAKVFHIIGSPGFPVNEAELRARIAFGIDRSYYPAGTVKQLLAITASGDRSDEVRRIGAPTLVVHGRNDPLVPLKNGEDTAAKIPHAQLRVIDGMGHDFAPGVVAAITPLLLEFLASRSAN
jgi:pimeloyl-ACP methyl ester carboxylesterase